MLKQLLILSIMVCVAHCYIGVISSEIGKSKTKEGFCEYEGDSIKQSESKISKKCEKIDCNEDYSIKITGCAPSLIQKCKKYGEQDLTRPYPRCCDPICLEYE
ncbi:unnamed protein product [Diamesa serratosioi]